MPGEVAEGVGDGGLRDIGEAEPAPYGGQLLVVDPATELGATAVFDDLPSRV